MKHLGFLIAISALALLALLCLQQAHVALGAGTSGLTTGQLRTAIPSAVNLSSISAAEGSSLAVCRADHTHSLSGTLPIANGGTNATATPTSGGVAYGTGTAYAFTTNPADATKFLTGTNPPTWTAPTSGGGWVTALDCDLTAESNQTLTADGNYTICGKTWTKENSAHDRVAMTVTNGTGLVVQPDSASDYYACCGNPRTAPMIRLKLSQLSSDISWSTGARILAYVSASNHSAATDSVIIGVDGDDLNWSARALRGYSGAVGHAAIMASRMNGGASVDTTSSMTVDNSTNQVLVLTISAIIGGFVYPAAGTWSSGWPAPNTWATGQIISDPIPSGTNWPSNTAAGNNIGNFGVIVGALRGGSGTTYSATIARLRVDYHL